jgi:hypothetical protein
MLIQIFTQIYVALIWWRGEAQRHLFEFPFFLATENCWRQQCSDVPRHHIMLDQYKNLARYTDCSFVSK